MVLENRNNNPLLSILPPVLYVKADENGGRPWLRLTTQYILTELENEGIGSQEVVNRMVGLETVGLKARRHEFGGSFADLRLRHSFM